MPVPHIRDFSFEYGVSEQLLPGLRRVVCRNPNPFTFTGTGTYLVGTGAVAVIDPGPEDSEHAAALQRALQPGEHITHIVITHAHLDHCGGARALARQLDIPIYGACIEHDHEVAPETATSASTEEGFDRFYQPDVNLSDGSTLVGDDWELAAIATPGHAAEHLCFAVNGTQHILTGDHIMGWATSVVVPPHGSMAAYLESLKMIRDLPHVQKLWPTHGPPIDTPVEYVQSLIDHRIHRSEQILELIAQGTDTISEIVPVVYAAYDRALWFAAAASVFAHVLALEAEGHVQVVGGTPLTMNAQFTTDRNS